MLTLSLRGSLPRPTRQSQPPARPANPTRNNNVPQPPRLDNRYTQPNRLAIKGGSNGGLLVAAVMVQQPQLFGAVLCQVPLTDMLRYHKFTIGHYWIGEYGNPDASPDDFRFLYAYSPLHNVKPHTAYPAALIMSADTDDRVVAAHAKKFAAALQAANASANPILLRIETKAGHGLGKPTAKQIDEAADSLAFLTRTLRLTSTP